jgi:uridine nucleosidase
MLITLRQFMVYSVSFLRHVTRQLTTCVTGESGLDGTTVLPEPVASPAEFEFGTIAAMYAALSAHPKKAWLVSTGTLTNVALLFANYPKLAESLAGLSIMGGAIGGFFKYDYC